ncbi:hypothetical protein Cgig2_022492 [Carnegiea gigantea]|uniref:F-box domain-containing protein n=1 Tax=Carnegiea gigantea TaxID=171969 RepID=A0A9Q1K9H5_9CARY|nr:hypothetical protein Cgig2_022492 [Carnegiea gigantea]
MASSRSYGSGQKKINAHQRGRKGSIKNKDLISSLPDDIVIHILSLLDQKEAVRASALSKRWRHMWALLPDFYNFDALKMLWWRLKSYDDQQYDTELRKYVRYVTQIASSSPAQNINIFRVRIPLDRNYQDDLQTWVNFAMARSVKELELNLLCPEGFICEGKCLRVGPFGCYAQSPGAKSLVSLSLTALEVSGPFIDSVLLNLPNLELLTMSKLYCGVKSYIRVIGSSLKLRYLEISYCHGLGKLDISAGNLISFVLRGRKEDVKFNSVPMLNEVSFEGIYAVRLIHNFETISGFSSQLTKLTLTSVFKSISHSPIEFPSFRKLKQLELGIRNDSYMSLPFLSNFIDACPVLNKFKLQCQMRLDIWGTQFVNRRLEATVNRADAVSSKPHHHLNTFEMVGFLGCEADTELVLYMAQFALLLEKVILHPLLEEDNFGRTKEASTREQAKLLRNQLPARIRLEIL